MLGFFWFFKKKIWGQKVSVEGTPLKKVVRHLSRLGTLAL